MGSRSGKGLISTPVLASGIQRTPVFICQVPPFKSLPPDTGYTDWFCPWFSSVYAIYCRDSTITQAVSFPFLHSWSPCASTAMVDRCFRLAGATFESYSRSHFFPIRVFLFLSEKINKMLLQIMLPSVFFVIRNGHRRYIPSVTAHSRRNNI